MSHHKDQLGARHLAGKLHAAQDIGVDDISRYADHEHIADATVKNILYRYPRIQAG